MSQENLERVRAGVEGFNRTGEPDLTFFAPNFELHHLPMTVSETG